MEREELKLVILEKALAQPAQKPVAWMYQSGDKFGWRDEIQFVQPPNHPAFRNVVALYTAPPAQPERKPLTDGQVSKIYAAWDEKDGASFADFARAIEAKLREKNQ